MTCAKRLGGVLLVLLLTLITSACEGTVGVGVGVGYPAPYGYGGPSIGTGGVWVGGPIYR